MPLLGTTGIADEALLRTIQRTLAHRGKTEVIGAVGGHTVEHEGDVTLAWSGNIRAGRTSLIASYLRNWIEFVRDLDGEFVITIRDHQSLYLVRDAAGARTAYFGRLGKRWCVAAEPKGIWNLPGFERRIRPGAVAQYFTYSFIPGSGTMLEDLWEVPAGHYVHLCEGDEPKIHRYFDVDLNPELPEQPMAEWPQRFKALLQREIATRLETTDQPAVFLSGGLDSSIVAAEVARQSDRKVRTFAIHFGKDYPNELEFARRVADHCGTEHEEVEISPRQAVARMRNVIWHLDDPIGDPITAPNFELAAHVAGQGITQVFNGEGGDPLFGGPKNLPMMLNHWYGGVDHSPGFRERRYLESYRRGFEELTHVLSPEWLAMINEQRDLHAPLTPFFESEGPFLHKLLAINTQLKGAHLILPKVERMLAASGINPLSPLFTQDMIRLAFASPPRAKLQRGVEKWLMKEAYRDALPHEIIERPKSGMRVPVHFWFKGPLRRYAHSILDQRSLRQCGIFNADRVQKWLSYDIDQPNGRYGLRIWMILTFEIWRRIVIDGEPV